MITKITVENFKSHEHTVIEPGRVTALVGPNGAGKTSLLQAISYPDFLADYNLEQAASLNLDPADFLKRRKKNFVIKKEWSFLGNQSSFSVKFFLKDGKSKKWQAEIIFNHKDKSGDLILDSHELLVNKISNDDLLIKSKQFTAYSDEPSTDDFSEDKQLVFEYSSYFKPVLNNLSMPSVNDELLPSVKSDGRGLATAVAFLMTSRRSDFEKIRVALQEIVPLIVDISVKPERVITPGNRTIKVDEQILNYVEKKQEWGSALFFDTVSATDVPAKAISEGTLITLAVLTILCGPYSSGTLLFDDIEAGLHPLAQRKLMQVLKEFAEKYDRQIILTTHSPYIVDELDAKDVWVMALDKEGITRTKRLSEHPNAKRALEVLTTGELWDAEGESWVTKESVPEEQVNA